MMDSFSSPELPPDLFCHPLTISYANSTVSMGDGPRWPSTLDVFFNALKNRRVMPGGPDRCRAMLQYTDGFILVIAPQRAQIRTYIRSPNSTTPSFYEFSGDASCTTGLQTTPRGHVEFTCRICAESYFSYFHSIDGDPRDRKLRRTGYRVGRLSFTCGKDDDMATFAPRATESSSIGSDSSASDSGIIGIGREKAHQFMRRVKDGVLDAARWVELKWKLRKSQLPVDIGRPVHYRAVSM